MRSRLRLGDVAAAAAAICAAGAAISQFKHDRISLLAFGAAAIGLAVTTLWLYPRR